MSNTLQISDAAVEFGSTEFWLVAAAIVVLTGLVAGLLTQGVKAKVLKPWAVHRGVKDSWYWTPLLFAVSIIMGTGAGALLGLSFWGGGLGAGVGVICGVIGGASASSIVKAVKSKAKGKLEEL